MKTRYYLTDLILKDGIITYKATTDGRDEHIFQRPYTGKFLITDLDEGSDEHGPYFEI